MANQIGEHILGPDLPPDEWDDVAAMIDTALADLVGAVREIAKLPSRTPSKRHAQQLAHKAADIARAALRNAAPSLLAECEAARALAETAQQVQSRMVAFTIEEHLQVWRRFQDALARYREATA